MNTEVSKLSPTVYSCLDTIQEIVTKLGGPKEINLAIASLGNSHPDEAVLAELQARGAELVDPATDTPSEPSDFVASKLADVAHALLAALENQVVGGRHVGTDWQRGVTYATDEAKRLVRQILLGETPTPEPATEPTPATDTPSEPPMPPADWDQEKAVRAYQEHRERTAKEFLAALRHEINCKSMENGSNTPDFILAELLAAVLGVFDTAVNAREKWYGRAPGLAKTA